MIQVSRYSSLDFGSRWKLDFQIQENYVQRFKSTDAPRVQYVDDIGADTLVYININDSITEITPNILIENETLSIREFTLDLTGLSGCIQVYFEQNGEIVLSSMFEVSDNVDDTILLEYTHRRNDFDTYFYLEHKFCFRVEGVFLPQENSFDNETKGFRDQRHKAKELSSYTIEKRKLTIGGGFGVPNWVARIVNNIFSLSNVYVDGIRMIRSDGAAIEITTLHNDYPLYIYKLDLETTEDEESADIISLLRVVDSKKKVARSTGDSVRTYNILAQELGMTDSKMIRELLNIAKITDSTEIEVDVPTEPESNKITLKQLREYILSELSETLEELKDLLDWFGMDNRGNIYVKDGKNFYTEGGISSGGPGIGSSGDSGGSLGSLVNVDYSADEVPTEDKVFVRKSKSTHWTAINLSEIVGLDTKALAEYLNTNKYATQTWVEGLGYLTRESVSKDFVLTTTFSSHVNNKREEKHVSADFLNSVNLLLDSIGIDDSGNVYIKSGKNFYTLDGGITAGGPGEDGGGASSGALSGLVDVALSSLADGDLLMYSGTHWVNIKQSELVPDLTGYATENYVDERVNALVNGAPAAYDTLKEIADVLAGNVNNIGDLMTAIGGKADKATTLSGYGITDAVTLGTNQIITGRKQFNTSPVLANNTPLVGLSPGGSNVEMIRVKDGNSAVVVGNTNVYTIIKSYNDKAYVNSYYIWHSGNLNPSSFLKKTEAASTYVTLDTAQTISGAKTFSAATTNVKSLTIDGFLIDVVDGALRLNGDVFATGGVSAGGPGVGGGSGISYNRLDDWASYNAANGDVLSALLGYDLKTRIDNIDNTLSSGVLSSVTVKVGSNAYSSVNGVVSLPAYPTSLKNPIALSWSGYSSGSYDGSAAKNITIPTTLPASDVYAWAKASSKPSYTFSEIGSKPTTLSGYGITDAISTSNIDSQSVAYASNAGMLGNHPSTYFISGGNNIQYVDLNTIDNGSTKIWLGANYSGASSGLNHPSLGYKGFMQVNPFWNNYTSLSMQMTWEINHNSTIDKTKSLWFRAADGSGYNNSQWHQVAFADSNVASATKLATPRTIWGQVFDGTGNVYGDMTVDGNIIAYGGISAATASDYRLKDNIRPLDGALALLNRINVKSFTYNSIARGYDKHLPNEDAGYIAQELEEMLPQYVVKMYGTDYLGIRYEKMIPYLTAGIQEVDKKTERIKQVTKSILAILERHGASEEEKNEIRNNINLLNN